MAGALGTFWVVGRLEAGQSQQDLVSRDRALQGPGEQLPSQYISIGGIIWKHISAFHRQRNQSIPKERNNYSSRATTLPQAKAPGTQVWEEKENILNMSFEKAAPNHKRPQLFSRSRMWVQCSYQGSGGGQSVPGPQRRPGGLAPPSTQTHAERILGPGQSPRTLHRPGAELQWKSLRTAPGTEAEVQESPRGKLPAQVFPTSLAPRPACHPITGISQLVGASSVICCKPHCRKKPEQTHYPTGPPRA